MMWRHLDKEPAAARAMPWWKWNLAVEGLAEEFSDEEGEDEVSDLGDLGALGFTARQV